MLTMGNSQKTDVTVDQF